MTQATCSWVADSEPCMLGSATLAIVPSSACMIVAIMTTTVSQRRRRSWSAVIGPPLEADALEKVGEGAAVAGVDLDGRAHADSQRRRTFGALYRGAQRDALHDLDPVASRVLRRQHGELRAGRRGERGDLPAALHVGIGVDPDGDRLADPHAGEFRLLEVGFDPEIAVGN